MLLWSQGSTCSKAILATRFDAPNKKLQDVLVAAADLQDDDVPEHQLVSGDEQMDLSMTSCHMQAASLRQGSG